MGTRTRARTRLLSIVIIMQCYAVLPNVSAMVEVPSDDEWVSCSEFKETATLSSCLCHVSDEEGFKVNCDYIVFPTDFPLLPYRQPITYFSQRFVNNQNLPPQSFLASGVPLQTLDLSNNWLRRLADKSFEGLSESLEILDLSYNLFGDQLNPIFSTNEFKRLPRLRALTLGNNRLSHLDGGILEGALSLEEFYLDSNLLRSVPSSSLKGPNALKILDLSRNGIEELGPGDFAQAPSLVMVNISGNEVGLIQGGAFRGLSSLKVLDLSWNRLQRLNSDSFAGLASIEELDISSNFFSSIPLASLKTLGTLKVLRIGSNLLQNVEGTPLGRSLPLLEIIDLSRNRLSEVPNSFFSGLSHLKEINLGVNQLRTLPPSIFEGLVRLEKLNLMDNNLLTFPSAALSSLRTLSTLILDYNRISAITLREPTNLTELSLANNLIREFSPDTFSSFPNLTYLNLFGNQIGSVEELALPLNLLELNLGSNQLRSIPRFQLPSLEILSLKKNQVSALLQHNFVLLGNLRELNLASNSIASFFTNSFDGLDSLLDLDLSGNRLEFLPKFGHFPELEILNFSRNQLKEIGSLEGMEALKLLDLSKNELSAISEDSFTNVSNLLTLDLSGNRLSSFRGLKGERIRSLDLSGNGMSYLYPNSFVSLPSLWNLALERNTFSLFPTEFLKPCGGSLRSLNLGRNQLRNFNEMNFSNFPHLRELDLSGNLLEAVTPNVFLNSSQLQRLVLSSNKLEGLDPSTFHGLCRLELDLSDNYLSSLPPTLFDRGAVMKLHKINLSRNSFTAIPWEALQKQYFYLEELSLGENAIGAVAPNLNILVNVKSLDLSFNPLDEASLKNILNEPKTARTLNLANCSISSLPELEMPFLRHLNLSGNHLESFSPSVFQRTTLLQSLDLSSNRFPTIDLPFPPSLLSLDLSGNGISLLSGAHFPPSLHSLRLQSLPSLVKVEKGALAHLKNLQELALYDAPKLGYLDIRGILSNLNALRAFELELKDVSIVDQLHPGLSPRLTKVGLRGSRVKSISTGAFAGLTAPSLEISLIGTGLSVLPSILAPLPMSSHILLNLSGSKITNLSPPFLTQNIRLQGLAPTCDCNAVNLVKYIQSMEDDSKISCAAPKRLEGVAVSSLSPDDLICESGSSTAPPPEPSSIATTRAPTSPTTEQDIIWSLAPSSRAPPPRRQGGNKNKSGAGSLDAGPRDVSNMDTLIFGIVGGVVALIFLFIIIIICFVKLSNSSSSTDGIYPPMGSATAAPSVISMAAPHPHSGGIYGTSKCTCKGSAHPHHAAPHSLYMMSGPYGGGGGGTIRSSSGKAAAAAIYGTHAYGGNYGPYGGGGGPPSLHSLSPYTNPQYNQTQRQMYHSIPGSYYVQGGERGEDIYESRR